MKFIRIMVEKYKKINLNQYLETNMLSYTDSHKWMALEDFFHIN